jgi:hypothetical protein
MSSLPIRALKPIYAAVAAVTADGGCGVGGGFNGGGSGPVTRGEALLCLSPKGPFVLRAKFFNAFNLEFWRLILPRLKPLGFCYLSDLETWQKASLHEIFAMLFDSTARQWAATLLPPFSQPPGVDHRRLRLQ